MCCRNGTLVALALFLILFCDSTSSECTQLGPCVCRLPDNSYYNLTSLADKKEPLIADKDDLTVYFHPCKDISIPISGNLNNPCFNGSGVSLCMLEKAKKIINLGTINDTHMKLSNGNNKFPVFEIHHDNMTSIINIVCVINSDVHFMIDQVFPDTKTYHFMLVSPYGCKKEPQRGLSTGSVLVILFFTFAGIYLIGGAVVLKTLRGATGWEMLPNHDFWCELPLLVRDGIVFTFNCCRANSYERI
ncbi:PREDICTED: cation-dependent mannose-6-phosphate receptor-like [Dinoponera quadriceps]|uniref:Cation-dependent mannose-6-phosphate receptor-like n=1 Tax=Dinoponera quadriceps TaxID=609295 RepID=A0A6P3WU73_DINQU|nr:PREDICTED: cation-dependent mannose-6-phosphate receptor-like [Dinoponera quadriceps]